MSLNKDQWRIKCTGYEHDVETDPEYGVQSDCNGGGLRIFAMSFFSDPGTLQMVVR